MNLSQKLLRELLPSMADDQWWALLKVARAGIKHTEATKVAENALFIRRYGLGPTKMSKDE